MQRELFLAQTLRQVPGYRVKQQVRTQRLQQIFERPELLRVIRAFVHGAEKEDRYPWERGVGPKRGDELQSGHARHMEVAEDEVGRRLENRIPGGDAVCGQPHRVAGRTQVNRRQLAHVCVIVDNENLVGHELSGASLAIAQQDAAARFHIRPANCVWYYAERSVLSMRSKSALRTARLTIGVPSLGSNLVAPRRNAPLE